MDDTNSKQLVNASLLRIKKEWESNTSFCGTDYKSTYDDDLPSSQHILQQTFYQDLDRQLDGLTKDGYVKELLRLCNNDHYRVDAYRQRLAERARDRPGCPDSRLVNRRNSANKTRAHKYAVDSYVIYSFLNGETTKDIQDFFLSTPSASILLDADRPSVIQKPYVCTAILWPLRIIG